MRATPGFASEFDPVWAGLGHCGGATVSGRFGLVNWTCGDVCTVPAGLFG